MAHAKALRLKEELLRLGLLGYNHPALGSEKSVSPAPLSLVSSFVKERK